MNDRLTDQRMTDIAAEFMKGIGFAQQPWLLYRHVDAGHPHMHIVTTNIRPDGSRIGNDLRSPNHLKKLCYLIEERYRLTPAICMPDLFREEQALVKKKDPKSGQRVAYGDLPTKTYIARTLDLVVDQYAYTSLESFNAALSWWRIRADRGREGSAMYNDQGLYYRLFDENGKKLGAPIKASAFQLPVTLPHLEEKFRLNEAKMIKRAQNMQTTVEWCLLKMAMPRSLAILQEESRRQAPVARTQIAGARPFQQAKSGWSPARAF